MANRRKASKRKKINPTLFVFCEGETEKAYVNFLKSLFRIPSIHIQPNIGGNNITTEYIEKYKQNKPTHEKDINFLIYDLDVPEILQRLLKIKNSTLLLSNPSIELWFLLHYKNQTANANSVYCCKELNNRNRIYKKGVIDKKLKEKLISNFDTAIKRAKSLTKHKNPSSEVYLLIEKLVELKK